VYIINIINLFIFFIIGYRKKNEYFNIEIIYHYITITVFSLIIQMPVNLYNFEWFYSNKDTFTIKQLEDIITKAREAYYNKSKPIMDDDVFDALFELLEEKDPHNKLLINVGANIGDKKAFKLPYFMGSMNKYKDEKSIKNWVSKYKNEDYIITDKLDGISVLLHFNKANKKYHLYTRGNGIYGTDITHITKYINKLPSITQLHKATKEDLYIRGELIISKELFTKYYKTSTEARNVVSGLVGAKTKKEDELKYIDFIAYAVYKPDNLTPLQQLQLIESYKFTSVHYSCVNELTLNNLSNVLQERKASGAYQIDGLVIYFNKYYQVVEEENPKHAFAFKSILTQNTAQVIVKDVEWNISKDCYLKPIVHFDPIVLDGCTIQKATGKNAAFIQQNKINIGSKILIVRSGGVIPDIVKVLTTSENPLFPDISINNYHWNENMTDLVVENCDSDDYKLRRIEFFFKNIEAKNISIGILKKLFDAGFDSIFKILYITKQQIITANIDGFKEKLISNIIDSIKNALDNLTLDKVIVASNELGRGFSKKYVTLLFNNFPDLKTNIDARPTYEQLISVKGFGDSIAKQVSQNYSILIDFIKKNKLEHLYNTTNEIIQTNTSNENINNKVFVFTGFRNKDIETEITQLNGKITNSISKNTDYLIVKDEAAKTNSNSKIDKAHLLNITILSLDELKLLL